VAELLFEIMCEEIPARMQQKAGADLGRMVGDALKKAGLGAEKLETYTGPRRLALVATVPACSPDISEERKGPRTSAPEQALAGFMRGAGISDISQAEIRSDKKGDYYVAMLEKKGRAASDIIAEILPEIMAKFPWPKSMKSGTTSFRWVRPLQSLLCLLDGDVVPFEVNGFKTGNETSGHRRMGKGPFKVKSFKDYRDTLEAKGKVIIDACTRKDIILKDAKAACAKAGLELVEDEGLLSEVAGLAEWPTVILGDMDESFLKLPGEVIRLSMRTHQKYFAVRDPKTGNLAPKFIVVANQVAPDGGVEIAKGNSRVLSARLDDARFFQAEDVKGGKKLIDNYDKLDGVIFHQKLGTIKDKSERVAALARELAPKVGADPDKAEQAARLAKCDLVTNMVVEFTSLQGQIGRLMYEKEQGLHDAKKPPTPNPSPQGGGEQDGKPPSAIVDGDQSAASTLPPSPPWGGIEGGGSLENNAGGGSLTKDDHVDIAIAIEEHYKPQGPSDKVPTNPVAVAVALADKLDTLVGFWAIDEKPTGSKDPFALRRAALGVVRIILENGVRLDTYKTIVLSLVILLQNQNYNQTLKKLIESEGGSSGVNENLLSAIANVSCATDSAIDWICDGPEVELVALGIIDFIADRVQQFLKDNGNRIDVIYASSDLLQDDLMSIVSRVVNLQSFLSTDEGVNLLAGYKRAANILKAEGKKGDLPSAAPHKGSVPEEAALFAAIGKAAPLVETALQAEDYAGAMTALAGLRAPIDGFFDKVIVNSDVAAERENRLGLLIQIRTLARTIADFDKIEG